MPTADANTFRGFELYPFQRDAIRSILADRSVIVAAPTGAGKTLVADFAIEHALAEGERIVYTSPVKALSN
ncbi:MAG: DEAD/DEAH box helicase, partial [Planctomycetota bacterium]